MARVDVLMPMRDAAATVVEAWGDLQRQTLGDWRLIVVDDGSRDGSAERLARAARGDRRLWLLRRPRAGIVAALQAGLRRARAPFVVRMDADDRCHPRRLERLVAAAEQLPERVAVVGSRLVAFPARAVSPSLRTYLRWQNDLLDSEQHRRECFVESTLAHATALLRTEALRRVGGWRAVDGPEDYELWLRLQQAGYEMVKLPQVLYAWRRGGPTETDRPRCAPEAFHRVRVRYLLPWLRARGIGRLELLGPPGPLRRWSERLRQAGFAVTERPWDAKRPVSAPASFALATFAHPRARGRARRWLLGAGLREERDWLFVG